MPRLNLDVFERYCATLSILDKEGSRIPLKWNISQRLMMNKIMDAHRAKRPLWFIVLKSRQIGASTLIEALISFHCWANANVENRVVAQDKESSLGLFAKTRLMRQSFADALRIPIPKPLGTELEFPHPSGSSFLDVATAGSPTAGRGMTRQALHVSEAAFIRAESYLSLINTVNFSENTIVAQESTANGEVGVGETFFKTWKEADAGQNDYIPIFIPWTADPDCRLPAPNFQPSRDESQFMKDYHLDAEQMMWRRAVMKNKCQGSITRFNQEYPVCVTGETRVSTERGMIRIDCAMDAKTTESGEIEKWGPQPPSTIWKLTTKYGRILRGTYDHPVHTPSNGFVLLSNLSPGQEITLRAPRFAEEYARLAWNPFPGQKNEIVIDERWGRFLGYFMGDGCWYKGMIDIACDGKDRDVVDDVHGLFRELIGVPTFRETIRKQGSKGCIYVRKGIGVAQEAFLRMGAIRQMHDYRCVRNVCVPEVIFRSPKSVVAEFLRSLFECDGSANRRTICFSSAHLPFMRDVQLLLLGFGINASIFHSEMERCRGKSGMKKYHIYTFQFNKEVAAIFMKEIGFVGRRKSSIGLSIPVRRPTGLRSPSINFIDSVQRIEKEPEPEMTYDLTVRDHHEFSANGILTHNTEEIAFVFSEDPAFLPEEISGVRSGLVNPLAHGWMVYEEGQVNFVGKRRTTQSEAASPLKIYEWPQESCEYYLGCDPARGIEHGDFAAVNVFNGTTGEQAAEMACKIPPLELKVFVFALAVFYYNAMVAVEVNSQGLEVQTYLRDEVYYPNLYGWKGKDDKLVPGKSATHGGWETNWKSREIGITNFREMVRGKRITIRSKKLFQQMGLVRATPNYRFEVEKGHDDIFFSAVIAAMALKHYPPAGGMRESRNLLNDESKTGLSFSSDHQLALVRHWESIMSPAPTRIDI